MQEVRKDIPWIKGYQASNTWNIRSIDRVWVYKWKFGTVQRPIKWKVLKPMINEGYCYVNIWLNNKQRSHSIHSLIMLTFIWERKYKKDINHKDWNKGNNTINNLEYCTRSENMLHAIKSWLVNIKRWKDHHKCRKIKIFWNWIDTIAYWTMQASKITWVDRSCISKKCRIPLKRLYKNNNWFTFCYLD